MGKQRRQAKYITHRGDQQTQYRSFGIHFIILIAIISIIGGGYWFWQTVRSDNFLPIQQVKIDGDVSHINQDALVQRITPTLTHGFFGIDMQRIADIVEQQPWVAHARVRRVWPATLKITINEHKPIARWGKQQLLAADGSLFTLASVAEFSELPQFNAPTVLAKSLWSEYQRLQDVLSVVQLRIQRLSVSDRRSWSVDLDNGMHIALGNDDIVARLGRFVMTYPQIAEHRRVQNTTIDLRYTNGFAFKPA